MTVLAFLLGLGLLITVHEWGHYRVAVACGVKVVTFSIGFGKPLLRWKSSRPYPGQDTEFVISLIPLGGFVKMLDASEEALTPADAAMALDRQPLWARAAIVSAGPLANFLLALALYAATFWLGQYETRALLATPVAGSSAELAGLKSGDLVLRAGADGASMQDIGSMEQLRWWLMQQDHTATGLVLDVQPMARTSSHTVALMPPPAPEGTSNAAAGLQDLGLVGAWSRAVLGDLQPNGAAKQAGLQRGDEVLRINGRVVDDAVALRATVRASARAQDADAMVEQIWDIQRAGQGVLHIAVTPDRVAEGAEFVGRIGAQVGEAPQKIWMQYGLMDGLLRAVHRTWEVSHLTLDMIGRLITGRASLDNLSGPLSMADYAGRSASVGLAPYLAYLALLSVSLGVFNLLPLPVLDGGHLLYYLYEAFTGHPPSPRWLEILQSAGMAVLMALMAFSLFNDVVRLGWLS
nr:RIP metalloprotease RseP [uncultured Limnohabitans sp.]